MSSINELVGSMRALGHPVVWVRQEFEPDLRDAFREMKAKGIRITIKGTQGCQIVSELAVAPSDLVIIKKRYGAFYGTTLDETLARLQPDAIILAGINTPTHVFALRPSMLTTEIGTSSWLQTALTRMIENITKCLFGT